jgi:hypothetical protein
MTRSFLKSAIRVSAIGSLVLLSACSTRQVYDKYSGSTAQRLVTYSIHKLAREMKDEDFEEFRGKKVHLNSHFIVETQDLRYAHEYFEMEFRKRFDIKMVDEKDADFVFDLFFYSLGTDQDTYGLTLPIVNLSDTSQTVRIDILAMDMYHGISEAKLYITDASSQAIVERDRWLARVRTDKVSTPIFAFPVSSLKD